MALLSRPRRIQYGDLLSHGGRRSGRTAATPLVVLPFIASAASEAVVGAGPAPWSERTLQRGA